MNAVVFAKGDGVRASSRDVAAAFEKNHRDVLRSIDGLLRQEPGLTPAQFCAGVSVRVDTGKQQHRFFEMNRDGFALLAMGFTGPSALKWKLAYIDAFNRMEASLRLEGDSEIVLDREIMHLPEAPDEFERIRVKLQLVREARIAFGPSAARRMWALADLPDLTEPFEVGQNTLPATVAILSISAWLAERTEHSPGQHWSSMGLFRDYEAFCAQRGEFDAVTVKAFSTYLSAIGIGRHRSNIVYRVGLKLRS